MDLESYFSEKNWNELTNILKHFEQSKFFQFCVINEILEEGMRSFLEKYKLHDFSLK